MNNAGTMAEMIEAAMKKKDGPKDSFTMNGQYAGSVQRDEDREFVMYESPNGEQIQVYGNWNEFAVDRDEQGLDIIADEDYPIIRNENGEYILDEAAYEARREEDRMEAEGAEEEAMQEEEQMTVGGKVEYAGGGRLSSNDGDPKGRKATPTEEYQYFKSEYEGMREAQRNSDRVTKNDKLQLGLAYDRMRQSLRRLNEGKASETPPSFYGGGVIPIKRKY
jgi:hypothetical protein